MRYPERQEILGGSLAFCALALSVAAALHGGSEEAVRLVVRLSARLAVVCFSLAFSASSIRALWKAPFSAWLLRNRRFLGLSFALFHLLHLAALVVLGIAYPSPFRQRLDAVTLVGGGLAYGFLVLQATTSNDRAVRWLGPRRWSWLHTAGSYYIWIVFARSYVPRAFVDVFYIPFALLLVIALSLRVVKRLERYRTCLAVRG